MRRLSYFLLATLFGLLLTGKASAQRLDGTLRVTITDGSQATIEDAKVTVTNEESGVVKETSTSSAGTYVFPSMLVGRYTITVEKTGFKKAIQKGISLSSNQVTEASIILELGSVSAIVEVEAGADLVQTQSSELNSSFTGR
ncbi:MAG TPA: carboxypeptidase-like regulatory domain-containing protein, partial [Candidatus Limnocylindrales bacterium]|nr:carboxypeptidase-like regulatory domain-containing protein [Candidatus Limnocylindrales bacterium]